MRVWPVAVLVDDSCGIQSIGILLLNERRIMLMGELSGQVNGNDQISINRVRISCNMRGLKFPGDSAIWEGPYSARKAEGFRVFHAYLIEPGETTNATKSLCGRWEATLGQIPPRFRRWGEGPAGMYGQKWCEDCRIKVHSIRTRLDADTIRTYANQRAGKGRPKRPREPNPAGST